MASVRKREWVYKGESRTAWIVDYTDAYGKRRMSTFKSKKDADRGRLRIENELESGEHIAAAQALTIRSLCDKFLRYSEDRLRDGRIGEAHMSSLKGCINFSVVPYLGSMKVTDLTNVVIERLYQDLLRDRGVKPMTARTRIKQFKLVWNYGVRRKLCFGNPFELALQETKGISYERVRTLTLDETKRILKAAIETQRDGCRKRSPGLTACVVYLAAMCGLRYGEIMGLQVGDIDFERNMIHVQRSVTQTGKTKTPKTKAGFRVVPIPSSIANMLRIWLRDGYVPHPENFLFRTQNGMHIRNPSFHNEYWRPLLERAGFPKGERIHFHALRHFTASWLIHNGWSGPDVALVLGHASFDTTLQVYAHAVNFGVHHVNSIDRISGLLTSAVATDAATLQQIP